MSSFDLANGYSKPIDATSLPAVGPPEHIAGHETLTLKRKLTLMIRSNANKDPVIALRDLFDVYETRDKEREGRWFSFRVVLSIIRYAGLLSVSGISGQPIPEALKNVRHSVVDDDLISYIRQSNEALDNCPDLLLDEPLEAWFPFGSKQTYQPRRHSNLGSNFSDDVDTIYPGGAGCGLLQGFSTLVI